MKKIFSFAIATMFAMSCLAHADVVQQNYEFNSLGDFEGFTGIASAGTLVADGDSLNGGPVTNNDPQLFNTGASIALVGTEWTTLEMRVREVDSSTSNAVTLSQFTPIGMVVTAGPGNSINGNTTPGAFTAVDSGSEFLTITVDISGFSGTLTNLRIDPIGGSGTGADAAGPGTNGNSFQVDWIRISDNAAVPEPSSLAVLGLGVAGIALRRRSRRS